jgi:hypothetical protein
VSDTIREILQWIGGIVALSSTATALAYALFRTFGIKWIETRFSERLEAFKHQQNQEIEHLRFQISTMLDRNVKLHQREFEVLPDAWSLLIEAFYTIELVAIAFRRNPDLNTMSAERLEEFLGESPLTPLEKKELTAASDKNRYYGDAKGWHDLNKGLNSYNTFHVTFAKNAIFIPDPLKSKFSEIDNMLKEAIIERQLQPNKFDKGGDLHMKGPALLKALESDVQRRLGNSNDSSG